MELCWGFHLCHVFLFVTVGCNFPARTELTLHPENFSYLSSHLAVVKASVDRVKFSNATFTAEEQELSGIIKQWTNILVKQFYQVTAWYPWTTYTLLNPWIGSWNVENVWHEPLALLLLLACCTTGRQFLIALPCHELSLIWFLTCNYQNYAGSLWQSHKLNSNQLTGFRSH